MTHQVQYSFLRSHSCGQLPTCMIVGYALGEYMLHACSYQNWLIGHLILIHSNNNDIGMSRKSQSRKWWGLGRVPHCEMLYIEHFWTATIPIIKVWRRKLWKRPHKGMMLNEEDLLIDMPLFVPHIFLPFSSKETTPSRQTKKVKASWVIRKQVNQILLVK